MADARLAFGLMKGHVELLMVDVRLAFGLMKGYVKLFIFLFSRLLWSSAGDNDDFATLDIPTWRLALVVNQRRA